MESLQSLLNNLMNKNKGNSSFSFSSTAFEDGDSFLFTMMKYQGNCAPFNGVDNGTEDSEKKNNVWFAKESSKNVKSSLEEIEGKKNIDINVRTLEDGNRHPFFSIQTFKKSRMIAEWTTGGVNFFSYSKEMKDETTLKSLGLIDYEKFLKAMLKESKHKSYDRDSYNCEHWIRGILKRLGISDSSTMSDSNSNYQIEKTSSNSTSVHISYFSFQSTKKTIHYKK